MESTEENTDSEGPPESPNVPVGELPDLFLYKELPGDQQRKLSCYVTAFNWSLRTIQVAQKWDPSIEEALMDNPSLVFIHP